MPRRVPHPVPALLVLVVAVLTGVSDCPPSPDPGPPPIVVQERQQIAGFVEPNTPGSGAPEEFVVPPDSPIRQILAEPIDLNRVDYVRTRALTGASPSAILILIPGFLGGAGSFDPIARDLAHELGKKIEVWAVDRRANQLEDRRGALHARAGAEAAGGDLAATQQAIAEGVRFYYPTADLDLDMNGVADGPFPLPDALPADGDSDFQRLSQDDVRGFMTFWGVDTYARDWRELVLQARAIVGEDGLVLFGGHSMGTTWTGVFAAYDFDPGPGVEAGHELVDGLLLLEGGGPGPPSPTAPALPGYLFGAIDLLTPGGGDVYLEDLFGFVNAVDIGTAGELNGVAGTFDPTSPSVLQTTSLFGGIPISLLLQAPMTNRSLVGFFLDDDFSTNAAFSVSAGFSANGSNQFNPLSFLVPGEFYVGLDEGVTRTWINFDSPRFDEDHPEPQALRCPPRDPPPEPAAAGGTGCAIIHNGPRPGPGMTGRWGMEREVTDMAVMIRSLYETGNASEWYFVSGRPSLDLRYGRDSSGLGAPELLNVTQNANVDVPVLAIGGSNGLATTEASFANYLGSIASTDVQIEILEGYAHVDVTTADDNEAVPLVADWVRRLLVEKRGTPKPPKP